MSLDLTKYRNIPYKSKGRDFLGVDCWGLLYLVYKHELGIIIPSYSAEYENSNKVDYEQVATEAHFTGWVQVDRPKMLSACLWQINKMFHVGICVSDYGNSMLHIMRSTGFSVIETIPSTVFSKEHRLKGYFEYAPN